MKHKKTTSVRLFSMAVSLFLAACLLACSVSAMAASHVTTVVNLNSAPVAENIECTTFRNVAVTDFFRALDPEGDSVTFSVTREPKKGVVTVDGDSFTYTPAEGKKGKDTFTYVATDSVGNLSPEATATINIKKQSTKVMYSDMDSSDAWYEATVLAEEGIFVGEKLGNEYFFRPNQTVTRGEFLVMCMQMCDAELFEGVTRTGFYDDETIPMWQKPYVATALMGDLISGMKNETGRTVFNPEEPITFAEATVMLNNALEITNVSAESHGDACPTWANQAVANLSSCNILTSGSDGGTAASMTRSDTANMLCGAINVLKGRSDSSLLSWAK